MNRRTFFQACTVIGSAPACARDPSRLGDPPADLITNYKPATDPPPYVKLCTDLIKADLHLRRVLDDNPPTFFSRIGFEIEK